MADNYNEGHPGYTISRIGAVAGPGLAESPNIVLLHAGTNDLNNSPRPANESYANAPTRLGALIDEVLAQVPGTVVVVAQIINAANAGTEEKIQAFNQAVPGIAQQRADAGMKVAVVDMSSVGAGELIDGLYPTPTGYKHMGDLWLGALQRVTAMG